MTDTSADASKHRHSTVEKHGTAVHAVFNTTGTPITKPRAGNLIFQPGCRYMSQAKIDYKMMKKQCEIAIARGEAYQPQGSLIKKHKKANVAETKLSYVVSDQKEAETILNGQKNLMLMGSSDLEVNLNITKIKTHSRGKSHKLNPTLAQLREHPRILRNNKSS